MQKTPEADTSGVFFFLLELLISFFEDIISYVLYTMRFSIALLFALFLSVLCSHQCHSLFR